MLTCSRCGAENPSDFRFCGRCAEPLVAAPAGRRERRIASILVADLVGFTRHAERLDIEDVDAFLAPYHDRLTEAVERFGGSVVDFAGDGMLAVFGTPVAHEDDPERAIRAALAIVDAVACLRDDVALDLGVRVGVTTGEVFVTTRDGRTRVVGDTVNTAARLESAAAPNSVLVDGDTCQATRASIELESVAPVAAKGKRQPVAAWRVLGPRPDRPGRPLDEHPFVGRTTVIERLLADVRAVAQGRQARVLVIAGDAGIGKSRLVAELRARLSERARPPRWLRGRSLPYGDGLALWALGEMVKAETGILESDPADTADQKFDRRISDLVTDDDDAAWIVRHLRALIGLGPHTDAGADVRIDAFAAWRRFLETLALDAPTVLEFEDLHWADDTLLDFIEVLRDHVRSLPLLVICTARPELFERRPDWNAPPRATALIRLERLARTDVADVVGQMLGAALAPDAAGLILDRAEGNPLYAQEYVRMLRDRGLLVRTAAGWELIGEPDDLPRTIHGIIAARLDTLSEGEQAFVHDAAVVGRTAWVGAVGASSGLPDPAADRVLDALVARQLVRRSATSTIVGETEFSFVHALVQDVAYRHIPRSERAAKHLRVGGWIEELAGRRGDKAEVIAHHFARALDLRRRAGGDVEDLIIRTRDAYVDAGRHADSVGAHASAAGHYAAALELTPAGDPARTRLLLDAASATLNAGNPDAALLHAALDAQVAAEDWAAATQAALLLDDWASNYLGDAGTAEAFFAQAEGFVSRIPDGPLTSQVASVRAVWMILGDDPPAALEFCERELRRAEDAGDAEGRALLLLRRGLARTNIGDMDGIADERVAAAALAARHHPEAWNGYHELAGNLFTLGDVGGATAALGEMRSWAERFGMPWQAAMADGVFADFAYHSGDWNAAEERITPLLDDPNWTVAGYTRWTRARLALARGEIDTALGDARMFFDFAERNDAIIWLFGALIVQALAADAAGDTAEADRACRRLFATWAGLRGFPPFFAFWVSDLIVLPRQQGALADAASCLPETVPWKHALTAVGEGRFDDAAGMYRAMGSRTLEAAASRFAGRAPAVEAALRFYEGVGATRLADMTRDLLAVQSATMS